MKISKIDHIHYDEPVPVYDILEAQPNHNFLVKGETGNLVVSNCDEVNFSKAGIKDVSKAKAHMSELYTTVADRIKGTFRMEGEVWGKQFAVSSKRSDSDFMEDYVRQQLEAGAGEHMYIDDKPQWEVMPPSRFHKEKFFIAVGDRYHKGFVVPDNETQPEAIEELKGQGFKILEPPIDMKPEFVADFDIALRDLAGIAVPGSLSFITQDTLDDVIGARNNPFYNDILQIGTKDQLTIEEWFHLEEIDDLLKRSPMFIHLDLSLNTDRTGISGVAITGRKDVETNIGNQKKVMSVPTFTHVFSIAIEAPRGDKIDYQKITEFIVWLRRQKFDIQKITRDQFQSEYMAQLLEAQGFGSVDKISLDRTPDGYMALRSLLLEKRIDMLRCQILEDELIHLKRDAITGKIDHPVGGCFTGDTKIRLLDGRSLSILELMEEQRYRVNWVYTFNEITKKIEPKRIKKVFQTKLVSKLLEITLDNGEVIRCTPEHKFMLRDSSYLEANNLQIGQSLMPLKSDLKVSSIEEVYLSCKVYDLEIEDNHNFALDAGVFVHNSKDVADSFAGAVWSAIQTNPPQQIPAKTLSKTIGLVNRKPRGLEKELPSIFVDRRFRR